MVSSLKVVLLGEGCVGKTCLALRFAHNTFLAGHSSTLQATFFTRTLNTSDHGTVLVNVWDTAGQERFHALGPLYYRDADAAVLVYDVSDIDSFRRVQNWILELQRVLNDHIVIAIAANKMDLDVKLRRVDNALAGKYARNVGASLHFTSAKEDAGVEELFQTIAQKVVDRRLEDNNHCDGRREGGIVIVDDRLSSGGDGRRKRSKCCPKSSIMI